MWTANHSQQQIAPADSEFHVELERAESFSTESGPVNNRYLSWPWWDKTTWTRLIRWTNSFEMNDRWEITAISCRRHGISMSFRHEWHNRRFHSSSDWNTWPETEPAFSVDPYSRSFWMDRFEWINEGLSAVNYRYLTQRHRLLALETQL